jgi:protein phosphatase
MVVTNIKEVVTTKRVYTNKIPLFVGDIHGMKNELEELLIKACFYWQEGQLVSDIYELFLVGDLVDRGPDNVGVLRMKIEHSVMGNHDWKVLRLMLGNDVKVEHGTDITKAEIEGVSEEEKQEFINYLLNRPFQIIVNDKYLLVHGGMRDAHLDAPVKTAQVSNLYGCPTGEKTEDGKPVRGEWWNEYTLPYTVIYGHTPVKEIERNGNTINIDTGAVFGNKLTAYDVDNNIVFEVKTQRPNTNDAELIL